MACRLIISPITKEEVQSQTWNAIRNEVETDQEADRLYGQLTTPEFYNWFGDWVNNPGGENVSKTVNEHGEPKVFYHAGFIKTGKFKKEFASSGMLGKGFYFASKESAENYMDIFQGNYIIPAFLSLKNPLQLNETHGDKKTKVIINPDDLQKKDGIIYKTNALSKLTSPEDIRDKISAGWSDDYQDEYVVFEPNQIKSIDNNGEFSSDNDNIQFSRPITYQEQLAQLKDRYHLAPVIKDGIRGYAMTMQGMQAMRKQFLKSGYLYDKLNVRYNATSGILEVKPRDFTEYMQMNREEQEHLVGREIFDKVVGKMADKLGVQYKIVTADEARELTKDAKNPYNGESAFYFAGTAYVLDTAINLTNGIHEVIHPFIDAVKASNSNLFNKLYSDFVRTNTGAKILQDVSNTYSDLSEEYQQKEILVRGLTALAKNNIEAGEEEKVRGIFGKLWFALKQIFRKLFGSTIRVQELNENTSLQQLADMLTGDQFKIDTKVVGENDVIQYNKELVDTFNDISHLDEGEVDKLSTAFSALINSQVGKVLRDGSYKEIKELSTTEAGRNQFANFTKLLNETKKLSDSSDDTKKKVSNLTYIISETKVIADKIHERLKDLAKEPESTNTIQTMYYFKNVLKDWKQFYDNLVEDTIPSTVAGSQLYNTVLTTKGTIDGALLKINKIRQPELVRVLSDVLSYTRDNLTRDHEQKVAQLTQLIKAGDTSLQHRLDKEMDQWKKFDLSDENLVRYLNGEYGDSNKIGGVLEAGISSSDPIIGGFTAFIKNNFYDVISLVRNRTVDMGNELAPLFKQAGIDRLVPSKLGSQITFLDKKLSFENGELKDEKDSHVITLLSRFKDYRYDRSLLNYNIRKAREDGDEQKALLLEQDLDNFNDKYMHRTYVDAYYELQNIWKTGAGPAAKAKREDIFNRIKLHEDTTNKTQEDIDEDLAAIEDLWKEYKQLGVYTDLNGNIKDEASIAIAKVIQEYNKESHKFYEWHEKPGMFEEKLKQFKQSLEEDGVNEGTEEYDDKVNDWLNENTRKSLKQSFYNDRMKILNRISEILSKLPKDEQAKLDVETEWKKIIGMTAGFRDEDGQPVGSDMTEEKVANIKLTQEKILNIQQRFTKLSGLTEEEADELNLLFSIKRDPQQQITTEQKQRIGDLLTKKADNKSKISEFEFAELFGLFDQLRDLQSKQPTDYYLEIMNNWLSKMDRPNINLKNAEDILTIAKAEELFAINEDFKTWFLKNHVMRKKWNNNTKSMENYYERLYVWNKIIPNDPKYYETYTLKTGETIFGKPTSKYYTRRVKDEFRTGYDPSTKEVKLITGVHVDNKHNFLPIDREQGKTRSNWDDRYINKEYERLEQLNSPIFKILQVFTKYHLLSQEDASTDAKLWMDLPRYRMEKMEYLQSGRLKGDTTNLVNRATKGIKSVVTLGKDEFSKGIGNFSEELKDRLQSQELFDTDQAKVPITGLSNLDVSEVSLDVGGSITRYMHSIEMNKALVKMNPVAHALMDNLEESISAVAKGMYQNTGLQKLTAGKKNNRLQVIRNMYEHLFLGIENKNELGAGVNKAVDMLMKMSSFGSLFVNVPGAIKNMFAANVQGFIETLGGVHINTNEYRKGWNMMSMKFAPAMISDYNKLADHSYETQLFRMFDFVQGKSEEKLGHEYTAANARNLISGRFGFFGMENGEVMAQGAFGLGLMMHQKVQQTLPTGEVKEIPYVEAFYKDPIDKKVKLKEGIDSSWGEGGKNFNRFKLMMHELSQKAQGNYAAIDQPELQRYTTGRLINFMRRYFVPAFQNRFSDNRIQVGIGNAREGYYRTALRFMMNVIKEHKLNWSTYNDTEKAAVYRTLAEMAMSVMFYLTLRFVFGWDPNDKDKYKKLKENSWLTNHAIYQLMMIKSEEEQFIPLKGFGLDELVRLKNTPSIAFGHFDKWYKLLGDITSPFDEYDRKTGFWDKGDNKLLVQMAKIAGFTGNTWSPEIGVKNTNLFQSRTK